MKFSALGDIAATLPFIRAMDTPPCIVTSPIGRAFFEDEFSDFIILKNKSILSHLQLIRKIRERRFLDLIDLQGNDRSRFVGTCSGSTVHNGYDSTRPPPVSSLVKSIRKNVVEAMAFEKKPRNYIVLNTGSSAKWAAKRPPTWKWKEFTEVLNERFNLPLKLTGSADEIDYVTSIAKELSGDVEVLAGKTKLTELKTLLRNAFLTVSTDSAALHISAVEKTPSIGIFGSTTWKCIEYSPWSVGLYDHTFYPDGIPPSSCQSKVRNYYDHIDLTEGLDALKDYLN